MLAADLRTLVQWLERDILSLAGPALATREAMVEFVVAELLQREAQDPSRIGILRRALQNQRDDLLAFARVLDDHLDAIARTHDVAPELVRATCVLHRKHGTSAAFWQGRSSLFARMGGKFHGVCAAVSDAMKRTPRSSSMVENLNSRLPDQSPASQRRPGLARVAAVCPQPSSLRTQPVRRTHWQESQGVDEWPASRTLAGAPRARATPATTGLIVTRHSPRDAALPDSHFRRQNAD